VDVVLKIKIVALIPAEQNNGNSVVLIVGNSPRLRVESIVIGITARRQSDYDCNGANLNAYNVLKQEGIAKPEDYSEMTFRIGMNNQ
jgi:hypothetical protein